MKTNELLEIIENAVKGVKANQEEVISVDAFLNYITALKSDIEKQNEYDKLKFESDLAAFNAEQERNIAKFNAEQLHSIEMFRSIITYGSAALKSAILINGGAAVALLAFIGNIWTKEISQIAVNSLTNSILYFSFGVLVAAVGAAGSYFTQYCYGEKFQRAAIVFHTLTVILVLGSYVCFGIGAYEAYESFFIHFDPNK